MIANPMINVQDGDKKEKVSHFHQKDMKIIASSTFYDFLKTIEM